MAEFGLGRLVRRAFASRAGWGLHDLDFVSSLRRSPTAVGAFAALEGVSDAELDRLTVLARVNAGRNDAMWRMVVVLYVTGPVTVVLAMLQAAPDLARRVLAEGSTVLWLSILGLAVWMLYYLATHWRARQVVAVLELVRIERTCARGDA